MIVVIGSAGLRGDGPEAVAGGVAGRVAVAAAGDGARVELVAKVGDDDAGDALLLALARAGVGHVAVLRDRVHATPHMTVEDDIPDPPRAATMAGDDDDAGLALDAADVGLALRYLTDFRVLVAIDPTPGVAAEAVAAADWAGARLLVLLGPTRDDDALGLPDGVIVIGLIPDEGPGGADAVSARIGTFAAALDRGDDPALAYDVLTAPAS